jgi:hypothetical protein
LLLACLVLAGCSSGSKETEPVQISGTVKVDGNPLPEGSISFVGEQGTVPDVLTIQNGTFEGKAKPGKKKVEIRGFRAAKAPPTATEPEDFKENYIGEEFNTKSKLTAEVTESGVNPSSFDVKAK